MCVCGYDGVSVSISSVSFPLLGSETERLANGHGERAETEGCESLLA